MLQKDLPVGAGAKSSGSFRAEFAELPRGALPRLEDQQDCLDLAICNSTRSATIGLVEQGQYFNLRLIQNFQT